MPISYIQFEVIGAKPSNPELIDFTSTLASQRLGATTIGDFGSEYIYVYLDVLTAGTTIKQGDFYAWDSSFRAIPCLTASLTRGMGIGTVFLGGRVGDPGAGTPAGGLGAPSAFSYTFPATGTYGLWMQRAGTSLGNVNGTAANANVAESTTTASQIGAPAAATVGSRLLIGLYLTPATFTVTANNTSGSAVLPLTAAPKGFVVGQTVSGTGIATGSVVTQISGTSMTLSLPCTSTNSGITVTATQYSSYATTTNGSAVLTNVTTVYGLYPNQTIAGANIPASTTILSINGNPGNYSITMSANATGTANNVNVTTTGYAECYLAWPYVDKTN